MNSENKMVSGAAGSSFSWAFELGSAQGFFLLVAPGDSGLWIHSSANGLDRILIVNNINKYD